MKYIVERIRSLFELNDSPHKLAAASALGIFIAFSPTIGLHTVSCFFFAWAFRLSKMVVITAAFVNNPWTIVPLYGFCLWIGIKITGSTIITPSIQWNELTFTTAYSILKPYLWSFVLGTIAVGILAAIATYFVIYWAAIRYRQAKMPKII